MIDNSMNSKITLVALLLLTIPLGTLTGEALSSNQNKWNQCQKKTAIMTQISKTFAKAGASPTQIKLAQKVACFESNMNCTIASKKNKNGTFDTGLFQINSVHKQRNMTNCQVNIDFAIKLSRSGKNWKPWSAYKKAITIK